MKRKKKPKPRKNGFEKKTGQTVINYVLNVIKKRQIAINYVLNVIKNSGDFSLRIENAGGSGHSFLQQNLKTGCTGLHSYLLQVTESILLVLKRDMKIY